MGPANSAEKHGYVSDDDSIKDPGSTFIYNLYLVNSENYMGLTSQGGSPATCDPPSWSLHKVLAGGYRSSSTVGDFQWA